jgi:ABC-type antimicrobial peptide transport system permease subunit
MVLHILLIILKIIGIIIAVILGLLFLFLVTFLCVPVRYRLDASMPGEIRPRDVALAPYTDRCVI